MLLEILEAAENFTSSEKQISRYILEHRDSISDMNVDTLAKKTYTSKATVVRFCKKLTNGEGFQKFKLLFVSEISQNQLVSKTNSQMLSQLCDYDVKQVVHDIYYMAEASARISINEHQISRLAKYIIKSDFVDLFGTGLDLCYAREMAYKLRRVNIYATALDDLYEYNTYEKNKRKIAILFATQKSLEETGIYVSQLKKRGYYVISFYKKSENPDVKLGDVSYAIGSDFEMAESLKTMHDELVLKFFLDLIIVNAEKEIQMKQN